MCLFQGYYCSNNKITFERKNRKKGYSRGESWD